MNRRATCAGLCYILVALPSGDAGVAARTSSFSFKGKTEDVRAIGRKLGVDTVLRLDPRLFEAYYFYARAAFTQGRSEKAVRLYEKSMEANPHDYQSPLLVAQIYSDLGLDAEAEACRRRGIQMAEARLKLNPDEARALYMGANGLVALGEFEKGLEWARQALAMDPDEPMVLYNVACIQSLAGCVEDAIDSLEKAVANGLTQKGWLEHDSNLSPLRQDPRYLALIARL